jgi:hypothetical protein
MKSLNSNVCYYCQLRTKIRKTAMEKSSFNSDGADGADEVEEMNKIEADQYATSPLHADSALVPILCARDHRPISFLSQLSLV